MEPSQKGYDKEDLYQTRLKDYQNFCRTITWTTVGIAVFLGSLAYLFL